jgi:hypothetical protein
MVTRTRQHYVGVAYVVHSAAAEYIGDLTAFATVVLATFGNSGLGHIWQSNRKFF